MQQRFEGKIAVITGASSGVGEAVARLFVAEGARVVLAARRPEPLQRLCRELGGPERAAVVPTDVGDADACAALVRDAEAAFGPFHVLVNNAGKNERGPMESIAPEELAAMVDVNLRAPVLLTRLCLPVLRRAGGGAVVNVASLAGMIPLPDEATYSATKFGLRSLTHGLNEELEGSGVTVSAVSPGPVDTPFIMDVMDRVPDYVFSQPMSTAEEVAALVLDCAADGRAERVLPRASGALCTLGYLSPWLTRKLRPLMNRKGARAKEKHRRSDA